MDSEGSSSCSSWSYDSFGSRSTTSSGSDPSTDPSFCSASSRNTSESGVSTFSSAVSQTSADSDDSEMNMDINIDEIQESEALYPGSSMTVLHANLLLMQFSLKHSLTKVALTDLLSIVRVLLPDKHKLPSSFYLIKKYFEKRCPEVTKLRNVSYCSKCHQLMGDDGCPSQCSARSRDFLYIPLAPQLERMVRDSHTGAVIMKANRHCDRDRNIRDVYDGILYKKHKSFLNIPGNISLIMNTDGVALFRSSTNSIWPLWLVINELPPNERFSRRNMLLAGLWYSKEKPQMNTFLSPLVDELNELCTNGIAIKTDSGEVTCRAILLMCSCDLPARAAVLNQKQFNGEYSCCYCEQKGRPRQGLPQVRDWPWIASTDLALRSKQSWHVNVQETVQQTGRRVQENAKGLKGATMLMLHRPFAMPRGIVIDILHSIFLGVVLMLLKYWFSKAHKTKAYSLYTKIDHCDQKLLAIKVPDTITRAPKSLYEFSRWKGSELRAWLIFYSLPVLDGVADAVYIEHLSHLVAAIQLLLSDTISQQDIAFAGHSLEQFYKNAENLYGSSFQTMNLHLLRHTTQCVLDWGPLWCYSCFGFEGMNAQLKKFFHGSRSMNKQLAFSYIMAQTLPSLLLDTGASTATILENKALKCPLGECSVVGKKISRSLPPNACAELHQPSGLVVDTYFKAVVNKILFYSQKYNRVKNKNSYTVLYSEHLYTKKYGQVQYFFTYNGRKYALLTELVPLSIPHKDWNTRRVFEVRKSASSNVVPLTNLINKCVFMEIECIFYVGEFPNSLTQD